MLIMPYLNSDRLLPRLLPMLVPYVSAEKILSKLISSMAFPIAIRCLNYFHYRPLQHSLHFDLTRTVYFLSPILFLPILVPPPSHRTILLAHFALQGRLFHYHQNPRISAPEKVRVYSWLWVNFSSRVLVICSGSLLSIHQSVYQPV